jgi:hypothetical protein
MSDKVDYKEIVFCNMTILHKGKKHILKKIVYKNEGNLFYESKHLKPLKINEPVKIINIKVISRLGFESKAIGYTEVKRNDEIRNKITGAYE